ncbi:flagellar hook-associated protein FlgK [Pelomonas sp. BJYL3]|uniref:flagellar hook-associated protein FlgK n=1 Tax=Pelomonas sp. BJYL3 TaxID=2976697 RepID=UPI0022B5C72D|nr:flagellar hook-associated protein FlgK [Pelomonas sp. BJYL3]
MGNSALMSLGMRAMFANQAALQVIGQNISNANTPGYSRQSLQLTTPDGQYTGAGYFGKGVVIETVTRSYNAFLTNNAASTKSTAFMDQTSLEQLSQLEKLFPPGTQGLGYAASQFLNAMVDVTSRPNDPSARQVVLGRAQELAARFSNAGEQLQQLQAGVVSDLRANVDVINQLSKQIAAANDQVARSNGNGHTPNDLLDKRDQLISQLSQYVQVTTLAQDDGTLGVFIGGGQRLVLGADAQALQVTADPYDPARASLSIIDVSGARKLDESILTGGSLSALLRYQNKDIQDARNLIGQMATALATRVNDQQALGWTLTNPPGSGNPIFSLAPPRALPAETNVRNPDGTFASKVDLTISDAKLLQASSYKLQPDATSPGQYKLTRLSDGLERTISDGDTVDGFTVKIVGAPLASTDSMLLEPVAQASVDMRRVLDQTTGIAAASPVSATTDVNNKGTVSVDAMYAVNNKLDLSLTPARLVFGDPNPLVPNGVDYTITLSDGSTLTGTWTPGSPIGNDPAASPPIDLGFELRLVGVPKKDDAVDITTTKFPASNNGNAKAFLNIQKEAFVGQRLLPDGSLAAGSTINDAYAAAMSEIGARVQGAQYLSNVSAAVAADAETSRASQAGVNLDEEAARLMQYQQGYQAAAKVLQTAQTVFAELLTLAQR